MKQLFVAFLFTVLFTGCTTLSSQSAETPAPQIPQESIDPLLEGYNKVTLTGTVERGETIGRDYCPTGIYLKATNGKEYLMKTREIEEWVKFGEEMLLGSKVEIVGYTASESITRCKALLCECDDDIRFSGMEITIVE